MKKKKEPERARGLLARCWRSLWRHAVAGLLVWIPLIITVWVTWVIARRFGLGIEQLTRGVVERMNIVGRRTPFLVFLTRIRYIPGIGFISAVALFFFTGFLTRYLVGRRLVHYGERLLARIPLISRIYRAVQQIRDVFISREGAVFQSVCIIEYPRLGAHGLAFVTSTEQGFVQEKLGKKLYAVFVPTTPNPTSGYLLYLPPEQITEIDMSVEDAMKLIISGGAFIPDQDGDAGEDASEQVIQPSPRDPDAESAPE